MKIHPYPIQKFAKPGVVYYSPDEHCLVAGNDIAVVRVDVDDQDEPEKNCKPGAIPAEILQAACANAVAEGKCDLRLTGRVARLDVLDPHGANLMTLEVPVERELFDGAIGKKLLGALTASVGGKRDPKAIEVTLNPRVLALMAAAMGSAERVTLVLTPGETREVERPIRVLVETGAVGALAPILTSGSEDKTGSLFGDDAQEIDQNAEEKAVDALMGNDGRRKRRKAEAKS